MRCQTALLVSAWLLCLSASSFVQSDTTSSSEILSADRLTREQFKALSPDTVIDFKSERMTKREFLSRRSNELEQAVKQMQEMRARADQQFEIRRKEFLDGERAKLEEANKKVQAEIARLVAEDNSKHGPNWQDRKRKAAQILDEAAKATPEHRSELEKKASDLLSSVPRK
jgi:hypothetical protein